MDERIKLSRMGDRLDDLSYPLTRDDAATKLADVTILMADGEANLGELVSEVGSDSFTSSGDLYEELQNVMPVEAIGEPGQSEGDA
ncbi:hypothetical protein C499_08200 [Halogeometricum borinquense DSM 11551]|uniref:DUF2795 domain-containing protein n=2 Tax=Halogeometricum borinquense TaxID=60847 RepID=E4NN05_HALBP|nr:hypothetical protein [Halogeometricum borinquense]ADQ67417.1 hypothetical protein Hbor_18500 [Halogeometricum borinquense DSM 11551]ELY28629.1 hypothetical protein C499_08200 [Halogeometricum borinquense DSM 11551]RYJ13138.1 hypothetical protein ELS19_03560 [Halogeometricum borinquense]